MLELKRRPLAKNIFFYVLSLVSLCVFFRDAVPRPKLERACFFLVLLQYVIASGSAWFLYEFRT